MLLLTVIMMDLLSGMEFDLFVPSFPEIQQHYLLSPTWVEALLSVNFAGYCLSLFFVGALADHYGRKPIILLGLLTFILGSIFCLFTSHYNFLLLGRFLQGVGIAAPAILSFLIIADIYPLKKQQSLMAILNGAINISIAFAPVIGSYLTLYFHWQGNFVALLFMGVLALLMTLFFVPSYYPTPHKDMLPLHGYLQLLQSEPLLLLITNILFTFVPYWIFVGMAPLLYIKDLSVSLAHFGYYQGILAFVFALGSILYGLMIRNVEFDTRKMLWIAAYILVFSWLLLLFMIIKNSINPLFLTLSFLPFIVGQIIPSAILYPLCLNFQPLAKGRVSALVRAGVLIFTALGLQLAGYFYQGTFRNIGIILSAFILIAVLTLVFVIKNQALMSKAH